MIECPGLEYYISGLIAFLAVSIYFNFKFSALLKDRKHGDKLLIKQAYFHPITELPNRTNIDIVIGEQIDRSQRHEKPFLISVLKIRNYDVNFIYKISTLLLEALRDEDILAHTKDDTFVIVFNEYLEEENFAILVERIQKIFTQSILNEKDERQKVEISMGHCKYPQDATSISSLIDEATRKALK